ncbi:hypothetical protein sos41_29440 [Alphaproteobacteria bacterium SO-S41]|nr:hypothetical protein sos41_29440 [Alphaproteobacteria bacterium SO-S41]
MLQRVAIAGLTAAAALGRSAGRYSFFSFDDFFGRWRQRSQAGVQLQAEVQQLHKPQVLEAERLAQHGKRHPDAVGLRSQSGDQRFDLVHAFSLGRWYRILIT